MDGDEQPHEPRTEWSTPQKARVKSLFYDSHLSKRAISRLIPMPLTSVHNILRSNTSRRSGKTRSGRPPVLIPEQVDQVIEFLGHNFKHRILPWKNLASAYGLECSADKLKRELANRGYHKCVACSKPFISESARQQRLEFITEYAHDTWQWEDVLWSDECTFYTGKQRKAMVIRLPGERYCSYTYQNRYCSGRASFSIWAMVRWNYKSPLIFLEGHGPSGGRTKQDYIEQVLILVVAPASYALERKLGYPPLYREGGNRIHGLKGASNLITFKTEELGLRIMEFWPASSPDFNPIEKVWRLLKQWLMARGPWLRLTDLKAALLEE